MITLSFQIRSLQNRMFTIPLVDHRTLDRVIFPMYLLLYCCLKNGCRAIIHDKRFRLVVQPLKVNCSFLSFQTMAYEVLSLSIVAVFDGNTRIPCCFVQ